MSMTNTDATVTDGALEEARHDNVTAWRLDYGGLELWNLLEELQ